MKDPVKRRPYSSQTRREAATRTRQAVLAAASQLFVERGYAGMTMQAVADEAGVAVDTVYAAVGTKPSIVRELIEAAISGTGARVPAEDRDYVQRIRAAPSAQTKLTIYARAMRRIHARLAPLVIALRDASSLHPELAALWQEISERRANNMRLLADDLLATGEIRPGLSRDELADLIWATNSPEFYVLLVGQRHWSARRYERWLSDAWIRLFLARRDQSEPTQ